MEEKTVVLYRLIYCSAGGFLYNQVCYLHVKWRLML